VGSAILRLSYARGQQQGFLAGDRDVFFRVERPLRALLDEVEINLAVNGVSLDVGCCDPDSGGRVSLEHLGRQNLEEHTLCR
jgi:hypothetical protein